MGGGLGKGSPEVESTVLDYRVAGDFMVWMVLHIWRCECLADLWKESELIILGGVVKGRSGRCMRPTACTMSRLLLTKLACRDQRIE